MDFAWKFQVLFVTLQWSIYPNVKYINLFNIRVESTLCKKGKKKKTESNWLRKQTLKKEKYHEVTTGLDEIKRDKKKVTWLRASLYVSQLERITGLAEQWK